MARVALITGGVRSGKSAFAQRLARADGRPVVYVATAQPLDVEFARRIARHRQDRPESWTTIEEPLDLEGAIGKASAAAPVVLVDDLTLWVSNRLLAVAPDPERPDWHDRLEALERDLCAEVRSICRALPADCRLLLVSQETGWGIVPPYALGRAYRDLLGRVNQQAAALADEVFLMVAGLAVDVRTLAVSP